jgi:hypothetical protein
MLQPAGAFQLMAVSKNMVEVKEAGRKELELLGSRAGRVLRLAVWIGLRRVESSRRDGASAKYLAQVHPPVAVHPCMAVCMIAVDVKKEAGARAAGRVLRLVVVTGCRRAESRRRDGTAVLGHATLRVGCTFALKNTKSSVEDHITPCEIF